MPSFDMQTGLHPCGKYAGRKTSEGAAQVHPYLLMRLRDRPGQRSLADFTQQPASGAAPAGSASQASRPVINLDLGGSVQGLPGTPRQTGHTHAQFAPGSLQHLACMARQLSSARKEPEQEAGTGADRLSALGLASADAGSRSPLGDAAQEAQQRVDPDSDTAAESAGTMAERTGEAAVQGLSAVGPEVGLEEPRVCRVAAGTEHPQRSEGRCPEPAGAARQQAQAEQQAALPSLAPAPGEHAASREGAGAAAPQLQQVPEPNLAGFAVPTVDTSLRAAQAIAAAARARCDVLRGPPRSSREDPNFQVSALLPD